MPLKFANNQSLTATTALPSAVPTDNLILISTQTASNSANISFTGINGTYDVYEFHFINIQAKAGTLFTFNFSTDGGSNYNVTKTSSTFLAYHTETDSLASLDYNANWDLAQGTGFQPISQDYSDADNNMGGTLQLFNPSSTTYVKHWISNVNTLYDIYSENIFTAGYGNTTSAINAIRFQMSGANFDGTIKMYGVKKS